jgi:hypothetical protein
MVQKNTGHTFGHTPATPPRKRTRLYSGKEWEGVGSSTLL